MADCANFMDLIVGMRRQLDALESLVQAGTTSQSAETPGPPQSGHRSGNEGLHELTTSRRFSSLRENCEHLIKNLDKTIAETKAKAPERKQDFRLVNPGGRLPGDRMNKASPERKLEAAIFERWRFSGKVEASKKVENLWLAVAGKQIPLFDARQRDGWGHIDLVAIGPDYHPVIVELKTGTNRECPLRPLLEAVSYAIALEKVWAPFVDEYSKLFEGTKNEEIGKSWTKKVVIMAPAGYWKHWRNPPRKPEGWEAFRSLVEAFQKKGFHVSFWQCDDLQDNGKSGDKMEKADGPWSQP